MNDYYILFFDTYGHFYSSNLLKNISSRICSNIKDYLIEEIPNTKTKEDFMTIMRNLYNKGLISKSQASLKGINNNELNDFFKKEYPASSDINVIIFNKKPVALQMNWNGKMFSVKSNNVSAFYNEEKTLQIKKMVDTFGREIF